MSYCPFTYRVTEKGIVELSVNQANYDVKRLWLEVGPVASVLEDADVPDSFGWRHFHNGTVWDTRSVGTDAWKRARAEKRRKDEMENIRVCNAWLSAFGLRVRDDNTWRATSLNAVIHPQFGPGYTAATNGTDVLLVSAPTLSADWMLVHRTNVIGPVSGTPYSVEEWDYVTNRPRTAGAIGARTPKPKSNRQRIAELIALEVL